ncbi:MAG: EamA family transporter [Chloroflexi bacterium]|nr:EamA family transporter [Chloroflexota bacterium]
MRKRLTGVVVLSLLFVAGPAVAFAIIDGFSWTMLWLGLGTASIHGVYAYTLTRGYDLGDLSSVYPIARGIAPVLVPIFAVLIFSEHVSAFAAGGIVLVVVGIYATHIDRRFLRDLSHPLRAMATPATALALLTGVVIASYTLWDKGAIDENVNPVTVNGFAMAGNFIFLAPFAILRVGRETLLEEWRERGRSIVVASVLAPLGYTLVLIALTTSRVSYVAPAREVGIVLGAALGVLVLHEGYGTSRIWGAALIVVGCVTLGVAP